MVMLELWSRYDDNTATENDDNTTTETDEEEKKMTEFTVSKRLPCRVVYQTGQDSI
jgi:hypothetical protein